MISRNSKTMLRLGAYTPASLPRDARRPPASAPASGTAADQEAEAILLARLPAPVALRPRRGSSAPDLPAARSGPPPSPPGRYPSDRLL